MCGRFTIGYSEADLKKVYNISNKGIVSQNYNVTPLSQIPVILMDPINKESHIELMQWGLVPSWSKEEKIASKLINARAETITEKPSFRKSFQSKRCIIPVSGFYEWHSQTRQPYYIKPIEGIFSFAGIWDEWKSPTGSSVLRSCSLITTASNEKLSNIHNRMPVILNQKDFDIWFSPNSTPIVLKDLLKPYSNDLEFFEVSKRVNSPINNDSGLIDGREFN